MAYNIGEKPEKGSYVCPNCGCRVGEIMTIAHRDVNSPGTHSAPHAGQSTYTVKSLSPHFAKLKSVTFMLIVAGVMFASGFATKSLLPNGTPIESRGSSSANPTSGTSLNVNTVDASINPANKDVSGGNPSVAVWVNTNSGVYHCSNTRWFGNTKNGKYMTQKEAQSKGYRPAHGSVCG